MCDTIKDEDKRCATKEGAARENQFEFGGPTGVLFNMLTMPVSVYFLNITVSGGKVGDFFSLEATGLYLGWLVLQALLYWILPGHVVDGQTLQAGRPLSYVCNGLLALFVSLGLFAAAVFLGWPAAAVNDHLFGLITAASVTSLLLSVFLYARACQAPVWALAPHGNTGLAIYDFYMGRELNPRLGSFDLKFFCELRPGLIGWLMLDLCCLVEEWQVSGAMPLTLTVLVLCHCIYVVDALYFERAVLTTLDITTEGFGFMLAYGDLTWVPFMFSLQTRYLLGHPQRWSFVALGIIFILNEIANKNSKFRNRFLNYLFNNTKRLYIGVGYWIFRSANNQKDEFRSDLHRKSKPNVETLNAENGARLLVSGWWGVCRHPNYLGDLIMAFSWCLLCGMKAVLPWFYFIYLTAVLFHRSGRIDRMGKRKHGTLWQDYCHKVKYRIIPYVF